MPESTEALVLEMGMSEFHETEFYQIVNAQKLLRLRLSVNRIWKQLGSKEGIAKAKLEILSDYKKMEPLFIQRMKS